LVQPESDISNELFILVPHPAEAEQNADATLKKTKQNHYNNVLIKKIPIFVKIKTKINRIIIFD